MKIDEDESRANCCVSAMGRPLYQLKAGPVRDRGNC